MQFPNQSQPATPGKPAGKPSRMVLANVTKGKRKRPPRVLLYGPEKIGKSTFASGAPSPVFLGKDEGTDELDVTRLPQPRNFSDILAGIDLVGREGKSQGWKTLVVDPLNWLEILVQRSVIGPGETFDPFSHATAAMAKWRQILEALERVWNAGFGVILLAHSVVKRVELPDVPPYDRFEIAMSAKPAGIFSQWVDAIMFARQETIVSASKKSERSKATSSGYRMMMTEMHPAYHAGNRYSLPATLDLSWQAFDDARRAFALGESEAITEIKAIATELAGIGDEGIEAKVAEYLESGAHVYELLNKLRARRERLRPTDELEKPEARAASEGDAEPDEKTNDATETNEGDDRS